MNKPILGLAALLMLGGTTIAVAQEGPRESLPGSAQELDRGAGPDIPSGAGPRAGGGRDGDRVEGPNPDARTSPPEAEPSQAERRDGGREKERTGARDDDKAGPKSSDDPKDAAKDADRKSRADRRNETGDRLKDKAEDKRDAQTKPDRQRAKEDDGKDAADADRVDKGKDKAAETGKADRGKTAEGDRPEPEAAKKADLSGEKRTRVSTAFRESRDVKRRTDVNIDISVGTRLPNDWEFVPVPSAVVAVVPEYRGYVFAYVGDDYVICDPVTYEVVAVLPAADGPQYAGGGGGAAERCSETLVLSEDERDDIVRSIQMTDEADVSDITVGWSVPGEIELKAFPESVVSRTGKLASCRYFVAEDQIAIVDPAEETVVLLIDHE